MCSIASPPCDSIIRWVCVETRVPKLVLIAPPVQILHPVLQEFLDRVHDPGFEPDTEVIGHIPYLIHCSPRVYPTHATLKELQLLLTNLLGGCVAQVIPDRSRTSDSFIFKQTASCNLPLIAILEYKCAIGEGECDPFLQAAYSL